MKEIGSQGGKATVKKRGKKYMAKIGKKGRETRWGKKENENKSN